MPVYKSTSVKEVIGRVIRTSRMTDMTYANDIIEWIGEGVGRLMIRWRLKRYYKELQVTDHMAKLPCGLQALNGVFYKGLRLRIGSSVIDARIQPLSNFPINQSGQSNSDTYFKSSTNPADQNSQDLFYIRGTDLKPISSVSVHTFYQLELDYIKVPFETGCITIFYRSLDLDTEGYPLIPDLEEAKAALFWYICAQMCFGGYKFPDTSMDFDFCDAKAEKFFRKAKNIIKDSSMDEIEAMKNENVNLIPPDNYYETFFTNAEQRKFVVK